MPSVPLDLPCTPLTFTDCSQRLALTDVRAEQRSHRPLQASVNVLRVSDWVAIDGIHHELEFGKFFTNYLQAYMTLLINGVRLQAVSPMLPI